MRFLIYVKIDCPQQLRIKASSGSIRFMISKRNEREIPSTDARLPMIDRAICKLPMVRSWKNPAAAKLEPLLAQHEILTSRAANKQREPPFVVLRIQPGIRDASTANEIRHCKKTDRQFPQPCGQT